jgi:hypothetical protein
MRWLSAWLSTRWAWWMAAVRARAWTNGTPSLRVAMTRVGWRTALFANVEFGQGLTVAAPVGAARHDPLPLARLSHQSIAGLALHRLVDAGELDGPDGAGPECLNALNQFLVSLRVGFIVVGGSVRPG